MPPKKDPHKQNVEIRIHVDTKTMLDQSIVFYIKKTGMYVSKINYADLVVLAGVEQLLK